MSSFVINRRHFLGASAGVVGLSMFGGAARAAETDIRMVWWGSEERANRTNAAIEAFEQAFANVAVEGEYMGWGDYWPRLATQIAGGNAPDLIQMDYRYVFEYARRGALLPLDSYLGNELKIEDFGTANLESCSVDGKLYGANVGVNAIGLILDPSAWENAGVEPPTYGTTWEDYIEKCLAFAKGNDRKRFYASVDGSGKEALFEGWLRGRGKSLYSEDGKLGYDAKDAADWFAMWVEMRKGGGCVPPDIQALDKESVENSPLILGYCATDSITSNKFVAFQKLSKVPLGLTAQPVVKDGNPSSYLKPSQMFSVYAKSKAPEAAVELANFLVRDPRGALILGMERGVPASPAIRDALMPDLDEASRKVVDFISKLTPYVGPLPPAPPQGAGEVYNVFMRVSQEVAFEASSPEKGGESLVKEANSVLQRG